MSDSTGSNAVNNKQVIANSTFDTSSTQSTPAAQEARGNVNTAGGMNLPLTFMSATKNNDGDPNSASNSTSSSKEGMAMIENNAFGFNFDSEDGNLMNMNIGNGTSPPSSEGGKSPNNPNNDAMNTSAPINPTTGLPNHPVAPSTQHVSNPTMTTTLGNAIATKPPQSLQTPQNPAVLSQAIPASSLMMQQQSSNNNTHAAAAAAAVANLQTIATQSVGNSITNGNSMSTIANGSEIFASSRMVSSVPPAQGQKRKASSVDSNNGYNSDDERSHSNGPVIATARASQIQVLPQSQAAAPLQQASIPQAPVAKSNPNVTTATTSTTATTKSEPAAKKPKKKMDDNKREERNAREKERSYRIARQINELRNLLSTGGVIVPKGTKSSVLTEAANYIRMLQQHQYKSEIDRHQLIQQIQMIGGGTLGPQAATAVKHVAAQNGVWSLGNFGGVPPKTAMTSFPQQQQQQQQQQQPGVQVQNDQVKQEENALLNKIEENDYRHIFNSASIGMAIASMGGAFIDCNTLFTQLSQYTKQEVCAMTIFNLTSRGDLQHAFDLVSQMISPPLDGAPTPASTQCVLRGSMKNRIDLGLNITLIKGEDGIAKCFCVTLIQNPVSPFDTSRPIPATQEMVGVPPADANDESAKGAPERNFMSMTG